MKSVNNYSLSLSLRGCLSTIWAHRRLVRSLIGGTKLHISSLSSLLRLYKVWRDFVTDNSWNQVRERLGEPFTGYVQKITASF